MSADENNETEKSASHHEAESISVEPQKCEHCGESKPTTINVQSHLPVDLKTSLRDRVIKWLEISLAVATFVVVVYYTQAAFIQAKAAIQSANAATIAANVASSTLDSAREQFATEQRPWIYAIFTLNAEPEQGKEPPKIAIWLSNTGKTPALDLSTFYETFTSNVEPAMPDFSKVQTISQGVLPPSVNSAEVTTSPVNSVMSDSPISGFKGYSEGKSSIYIRGKIDYSDTLKNKYWVSFCAYHTRGPALNIFTFCKDGNAVGQYPKQDCPEDDKPSKKPK